MPSALPDEPPVPKERLKKGTIEPEVTNEECEKEKKRSWAWVWTYAGVLLVLGVALYLVYLNVFPISKNAAVWAQKLLRGAIFSILILAVSKLVDALAISRLSHDYTRYNLRKVLRLVTFILVCISIISIIFVNWYAAAVSLGLISLILGFALQSPITSFIGWIYILVKRPYTIGDRIEIQEVTGDVIDVGYLDTTLWEFGGKYLSTDHPSGRIIKFPNSLLFNTTVYNYTWSYFPYIWNEISLYVAYNSDLQFISITMERIVAEYLGKEMLEHVQVFRNLLSDTPIDNVKVNEKPTVFFRSHENTWIEANVRYLVHPRQAGFVKSALIKQILEALNTAPEKVMFPKGDAR